MKVTIKEEVVKVLDVPYQFPIYRTRLVGEYGFSGFEKTYWKFESFHKVTIIKERMCETSFSRYDDTNHNFFQDWVTENMLHGQYDYSIITEKVWTSAVDRLVTELSKGI
jgi:hypothetical protein